MLRLHRNALHAAFTMHYSTAAAASIIGCALPNRQVPLGDRGNRRSGGGSDMGKRRVTRAVPFQVTRGRPEKKALEENTRRGWGRGGGGGGSRGAVTTAAIADPADVASTDGGRGGGGGGGGDGGVGGGGGSPTAHLVASAAGRAPGSYVVHSLSQSDSMRFCLIMIRDPLRDKTSRHVPTLTRLTFLSHRPLPATSCVRRRRGRGATVYPCLLAPPTPWSSHSLLPPLPLHCLPLQ